MRHVARSTSALACLFVLAASCGEDSPEGAADAGVPDPSTLPLSTAAMVGSDGAELRVRGATIEVPAGALADDVEIQVTAQLSREPAGFDLRTPVMRFEPDGLEFAQPVEVRFDMDEVPEGATVYWTSPDGATFEPRSTRVEGNEVVAQIDHFSEGFVGFAQRCAGTSCCVQATSELDVLLVVDNSLSMTEEQLALSNQLGPLVQTLVSGDLDDDGIQDFPVASNIQFGVVSVDMGIGDARELSCRRPDFGDDGVLEVNGNPDDPSCAATYPAIQSFDATAGDDPVSFAQSVGCVARLGTDGCGFEQQLEAALKAITPASSPLRFVSDTLGHGDTTNAGLVRDESVLAVVIVTDEEDCSAEDPAIFDLSDPTYPTTEPNLRCLNHPEALHRVSRYVDGFLALRDHPSRLVYAAVAGIPPGLLGGASPDFDAILADPGMQFVVDPDHLDRPAASCNTPQGLAFPPRRLVQTGQALNERGAGVVLQSICEADPTNLFRQLLSEVADRLSGVCG